MADSSGDPDRISVGDSSGDDDGPELEPVYYSGTPFYICPNSACTACHTNYNTPTHNRK